MEEIKVCVYGPVVNNAVVKLPNRRYPGVLIQGDSLSNLLETSEEIFKGLQGNPNQELVDGAEWMRDYLKGMYEQYLDEIKGIEF